MPRMESMDDVVEALRKDGIFVRDEADVKIEGEGEQSYRCSRCGHELRRALACWVRDGVYALRWTTVCPDRPACRRRRADAEEERVRCVLEAVVV